jgi:hypothetical protein
MKCPLLHGNIQKETDRDKVNRDRYNIVDAPSGSCIFFHYCWISILCS